MLLPEARVAFRRALPVSPPMSRLTAGAADEAACVDGATQGGDGAGGRPAARAAEGPSLDGDVVVQGEVVEVEDASVDFHQDAARVDSRVQQDDMVDSSGSNEGVVPFEGSGEDGVLQDEALAFAAGDGGVGVQAELVEGEEGIFPVPEDEGGVARSGARDSVAQDDGDGVPVDGGSGEVEDGLVEDEFTDASGGSGTLDGSRESDGTAVARESGRGAREGGVPGQDGAVADAHRRALPVGDGGGDGGVFFQHGEASASEDGDSAFPGDGFLQGDGSAVDAQGVARVDGDEVVGFAREGEGASLAGVAAADVGVGVGIAVGQADAPGEVAGEFEVARAELVEDEFGVGVQHAVEAEGDAAGFPANGEVEVVEDGVALVVLGGVDAEAVGEGVGDALRHGRAELEGASVKGDGALRAEGPGILHHQGAPAKRGTAGEFVGLVEFDDAHAADEHGGGQGGSGGIEAVFDGSSPEDVGAVGFHLDVDGGDPLGGDIDGMLGQRGVARRPEEDGVIGRPVGFGLLALPVGVEGVAIHPVGPGVARPDPGLGVGVDVGSQHPRGSVAGTFQGVGVDGRDVVPVHFHPSFSQGDAFREAAPVAAERGDCVVAFREFLEEVGREVQRDGSLRGEGSGDADEGVPGGHAEVVHRQRRAQFQAVGLQAGVGLEDRAPGDGERGARRHRREGVAAAQGERGGREGAVERGGARGVRQGDIQFADARTGAALERAARH